MRHHPDLRLYGALLYTDSLAKTEASLRGEWKPYVDRENKIFLLPTEFEGLAAIIREKPVVEWQAELCREEWIFLGWLLDQYSDYLKKFRRMRQNFHRMCD